MASNDMEYQMYYEDGELLLEESRADNNIANANSVSKNSWDASDSSMDNGNDCFEWGELKIDEGDNEDGNARRKRKFEAAPHQQPQDAKTKRSDYTSLIRDPLAIEVSRGQTKKSEDNTGLLKLPVQWHEDINDLNTAIIDSSTFTLQSTNNYTIGASALAISGLTVFKQEAPSPTHDVSVQGHRISKSNSQSPTSTQDLESSNHQHHLDENSSDQHMINNTITQLLNQSNYSNLQNAFDANFVSSPQDQYNVSSSNVTFSEDCRFQYVLAAATSIATKTNEDTLTYLNQGQSYEIKLKKLGDLSMYRGKVLKSTVRMCFHERRLQYMEKEQMALWQRARPGDRILDVDIPLSYGATDIYQPSNALNMIHFNWDPTKEVGVYIKVNCISTEFTPKKHGGEKGVPFRIQVETYTGGKRLHAAACQIKVFKLKGADRKHKQDREKIMKRPPSEQEKYQPSYECTVLNDISIDSVFASSPISALSPTESESSSSKSNLLTNNQLINATQPHQGIFSSIKQQPQSPIVQVVAPLQQSVPNVQEPKRINQGSQEVSQIKATSTNEEVIAWLIANRCQKFTETFQNFNGHDLLRLSRIDMLQLCGEPDGIRLFNILHDRAIIPRSTIYVRQENTDIFHALFLTSPTKEELKKELCENLNVPASMVNEIFLEGPNQLCVLVTDAVVYYFKNETAFSVKIRKEKSNVSLLLKNVNNN